MIEVKSLSISYKSTSSKVLDDISFDIKKGEVAAIMGPSGCGKTTLLNYLQGINRGSVVMTGSVNLPVTTKVRTVFQESRLLPWLNVLDNVSFGLDATNSNKNENRLKAGKYVNMVGLTDSKSLLPRELSIGMQQRVNFARALACEPDLLLLDEPFSALDVETKGKLQKEFLKIIKDKKITAVFVTHSIEEATKLADNVIVLTARPAIVESILKKGEVYKGAKEAKMEFDPFEG